MKRDTIKLDNENWKYLVQGNYFEINGVEIDIEEIECKHVESHRHTEKWRLVFKRLDNDKFYSVYYENSIKGSMDWEECNYGGTEAIEVFPKQITKTVYE